MAEVVCLAPNVGEPSAGCDLQLAFPDSGGEDFEIWGVERDNGTFDPPVKLLDSSDGPAVVDTLTEVCGVGFADYNILVTSDAELQPPFGAEASAGPAGAAGCAGGAA